MNNMSCRIAIVLGVSTLLATGTIGCGWTGYQPASYKATTKSSTPVQADRSLDVQSENGAITVQTWDLSEVQVEATIRATSQERLDKTNVVTKVEGNTIVVSVQWPDGKRNSSEGADLSIRVPKCKDSVLKTSNGTIQVTGRLGTGKFHTSNGAVSATDSDGELDLSSSNGAITVVSAHAPVTAKTSNGKININLADDAKGPVNLASSNGAIALEVGSAFTGSGVASTSNSSCVLTSNDGKTVKGKSIQYSFGSGDSSKLKTSNGNVTITERK